MGQTNYINYQLGQDFFGIHSIIGNIIGTIMGLLWVLLDDPMIFRNPFPCFHEGLFVNGGFANQQTVL